MQKGLTNIVKDLRNADLMVKSILAASFENQSQDVNKKLFVD